MEFEWLASLKKNEILIYADDCILSGVILHSRVIHVSFNSACVRLFVDGL